MRTKASIAAIASVKLTSFTWLHRIGQPYKECKPEWRQHNPTKQER